MRILHLVSYPLFSGPLPPTLALAAAQAAMGHRVHVACDARRGHLPAFEEAALPHLGALAAPFGLTLSTKGGAGALLRDWRALRALAAGGEVDVLHAHQSHDHSLLAALPPTAMRGVTRVRTVHAPRLLRHRLACRLWGARTDAWLVRCRAHATLLQERLGPRLAGRVHRIPGSVDAARFAPASDAQRAAARQALGLPARATLVGQAALLAGRGQEALIAALRELPPHLHVALLGRGTHEAALRRQVVRLGLGGRVHFLGYRAGDALLVAYRALDAAYVAQAGNDASTRAALEAAACGLPLLAPRQEALAELVDAVGGYPMAARDAANVAAALAALDAGGAARRRELGARGRAYVLAERQVAGEAAATLAVYGDARRARPPALLAAHPAARAAGQPA